MPFEAMINVQQALQKGLEILSQSNIDNPRLDVEVLLAHSLVMSREDLFIHFERQLSQQEQEAFESFLARRIENEPVARILGFKEFWSLNFKLNDATLIPRPDSETLVAEVISYLKKHHGDENIEILDLGTGSGCLLLSILSEIKFAKGCGVDAEKKALIVAKENASQLGLADKVEFKEFNWLSGAGADLKNHQYDIIISNPPYIESGDIAGLQPDVSGFDPKLALDGGEDGLLHYRALAMFAKSYMQKGGRFFLEIGMGQEAHIIVIFENQGWQSLAQHKDLSGIVRVLVFGKS